MELLRPVRCLSYLPADPPVPAVKLRVANPVDGTAKEYTAPLDTGFAGYLMVPEPDYSRLASIELPTEAWGRYSTLAGPVVMKRGRVEIELFGQKFETVLETPLYGGGKLLLGRRILNTLDVALMGGSRVCALEAARD